jgi:serine/threonine-protein kinase PknK
VRDRDTELAVVRAELSRERGRYDYTAIVGASEGMRRVFQQLDRIIETELPVLIHGESGTGKELIARAIHFNGPRKDKPFVSENCAALPDTLLESELFGHARGAFTGAHKAKKGLLEQADGGTLFLDEIGDMSPRCRRSSCACCRRASSAPLGSDQRVKVDVRIIAASHRDLEQHGEGTASSARTSTTASTCSRCACRRCASGARTSRCSPTRSWRAPRARPRRPAPQCCRAK